MSSEPVALGVPSALATHIRALSAQRLGGLAPTTQIDEVAKGVVRIRLHYQLDEDLAQDDWRVAITPSFTPTFHWAPHLTPTPDHIIDQHSFRSPALIVSDEQHMLAIVPDLDLMQQGTPVRWYLDLDAPHNELVLGMSDYAVKEHVLYVRKPGARHRRGQVTVGFYVIAREAVDNPFREVLSLLWTKWGRRRFEAGEPLTADLSPYVEHTYRWAFDTWGKAVWQELTLDGRRVGAPVFIVNQTQSPNFPGVVDEREFRSIWNQAWFSSLRSASGLFRYARRAQNAALLERARMSKELALAAPQTGGWFPSVLATEMEQIEVDGETVNRSKGWGAHYWGNSDRNPIHRPATGEGKSDVRDAPFHVLDMSFTALLMLRWYDELEPDDRLLAFATRYADALIARQGEDGFFPAWIDRKTGASLGVLDDSPETSMSATFLLKLAQLTGEEAYQKRALLAVAAVTKIVPTGRWEDFETYWSCAPWGKDALIGKKIARNDMFKQNNLSMFWTAEALLAAYDATGDPRHLAIGKRVLDELLMTQASWQPPYMYVNVLGGFGVMNADGEWNDSRSSLFAELIIRYGQITDNDELVQRGLAAMRSSFVMMYCPENPKTRVQWEKKYPFFNQKDFGFTMENYGHGGETAPDATGMGVFTIYDWGNGAAAEAYNRLLDHLGAELVLRAK